MELESFFILHQNKLTGGEVPPAVIPNSFFIETCQRRFWVSTQEFAPKLGEFGGEIFEGEEAYRWLLEVGSGLWSANLGETEVFGQIRQAWSEALRKEEIFTKQLLPWIQKVFEDVKDIRTQCLQGSGGSTYGSLVRSILNPNSKDLILLIGAGLLARSVAPYLVDSELWLMNRSKGPREDLARELEKKSGKKPHLILTSEDEIKIWKTCKYAVVCVPHEPVMEAQRLKNWKQGNSIDGRKVLHLGCLRGGASGIWEREKGFLNLSDLFDLQSAQDSVRSLRVERAKRACFERARLRAMGGSLGASLGWEDLLAFALP